MGILQSSIHIDNINGVIDNQSQYQIQYRVTGPLSNNIIGQLGQLSDKSNPDIEMEQFNADTSCFQYGGSVPPYSTKYYQFKDIQNRCRFQVFVVKINHKQQLQAVVLEKKHKIQSESVICVRVTPELKVVHLGQVQIDQLQIRKVVEKQFMNQSKIVVTAQLSHRLYKLLPDNIRGIKLLFRASEHNFDIRQFYARFGSKTDVLLLCQTNTDKIIGGYSNNSMVPRQPKDSQQKQWQVIYDEKNSSFIFTLSSNDIFHLKQGQVALFYNRNEEQICFGSDQLRINNKSNLNNCLTANLNTNYQNHNYNNDSGSYLILNGNKTPQFTTKEWEAWTLEYKQYNQEQDNYVIDV